MIPLNSFDLSSANLTSAFEWCLLIPAIIGSEYLVYTYFKEGKTYGLTISITLKNSLIEFYKGVPVKIILLLQGNYEAT